MPIVLTFVAAYIVGGFPTGVILSKWLLKRDIRRFGSGNPGAMNIWRVFGLHCGLLVVSIDVGKGYFAVKVLPLLVDNEISTTYLIVLGFLAICGHVWSPWTRLQGGKGVGTAFGTMVAIFPAAALATLMLWLGTAAISRYASVAAITAAVCYPGIVYLVNKPSLSATTTNILIALLLIYTHRENLYRLRSGRELKIGRNR